MLRVGAIAPDFEALDQKRQLTTLGQLLAKSSLVLFFYPKDFTTVCTRESCLFRDAHAELASSGLQVVGVSPDTVETHAQFAAQHQLPYPLLADPELRIINAYEARRPLLGMIKRITYVIAQNRVIRAASHHDLSASKHLEEVRAAAATFSPA